MNYKNDNVRHDEHEFIRRCLLEDSKNRKKYVEIRIKKGIVNDFVITEQKLPNEGGENMPTTKDNKYIASVNIDTAAEIKDDNTVEVTTVSPIEVEAVEVVEQKPVVHKPTPAELAAEKKALEKQKEKERLAKEKEKQKEKERLAREKEKQKEKERLAREKEKQKEKERLAKEKEKQLEKERLAKEKAEAKQQEAAKKPIPQKINIAELQTKKVVPVSENTEPENVETVDIVDEEPTTIDGRPVDNIARLRQKMLAQKRLERELMEKESKVQPTKLEPRYIPIEDEEEDEEVAPQLLDAKKQIDELREENSDLFEKISKLEQENAELKSAMEQKSSEANDEEIEKLNKLIDQLDKEIEDKNAELESKEEFIKALEFEMEELRHEIEDLEQEISDMNAETDPEVKELSERIELINKEHSEEIEKIHESYVDEISDLRSEIDELKAQDTEALQNELNEKVAQIALLTSQVALLQDSKDQLEASEKRIAELEVEINHATELIVELEEKADAAEKALAAQEAEANKDEEIARLTEQLAQKEADALEANEKAEQIELLTKQLAAKDEEIAKLTEELQNKEPAQDKDEEIAALYEKLEAKEQEIIDLSNDTAKDEEIASLLRRIQELEEENKELAKLAEMKQYITDLEADKAALEQANEANTLRIAELESSLQEQPEEVEEDPDVVAFNEEITQKIAQLEAEIATKDQQLLILTEKFNSLKEEDIIDPEFKRKIREIRDMKQEVIESSNIDRANLQASVDSITADLEKRRETFAEVSGRLNALDKEHQKVGSRSSLNRENYLAKRSVIMTEYNATKERVKAIEEEQQIAILKLNTATVNAEERIAKLNQAEAEIIAQYLEQLRADYIDNDADYITKMEEKDTLIRQLDELNQLHHQTQSAILASHNLLSETLQSNRELRERLLAGHVTDLDQRIDTLTNNVDDLTAQYNNLVGKINLIKQKQEERMVAEDKLRNTEESIIAYVNVNEDYNSLISTYYVNNVQVVAYRSEINALVNEANIEEADKVKVELNDLLIIQSDLLAKIEYVKRQLNEISDNERVKYYIRLVKSMEQLRSKNIELRSEAAKIKEQINSKKIELELLKEEKAKL